VEKEITNRKIRLNNTYLILCEINSNYLKIKIMIIKILNQLLLQENIALQQELEQHKKLHKKLLFSLPGKRMSNI